LRPTNATWLYMDEKSIEKEKEKSRIRGR